MNDVTGMPQTAVVLGATSDIARALLRELAGRRLDSVLLTARNEARLEEAARELSSLGVTSVKTALFDVVSVEEHDAFANRAKELLGSIDLVIVATGDLSTSDLDELNADAVAISINTNFTGPAAALIAFSNVMRHQGHGRLVVLSSVAGVRVRRANFVYGSGKAGLDGFCLGLADALFGSGVKVMVVRPGFVHTKMTVGLRAAPLAVSADVVATAIVRGLERDDAVVWVPAILRVIFAAFRVLPRQIWRRIPN